MLGLSKLFHEIEYRLDKKNLDENVNERLLRTVNKFQTEFKQSPIVT